MCEYKPNSYKSKESEFSNKKIERVTRGTVKTKKKNEFEKIASAFISEDFNLSDILAPVIKKAVFDIVTNGIDMLLYGDTSHCNNKTAASKVSYGKYYDKNEQRCHTKPRYSYDDVILESRGEAEDVLNRMDELIDVYGAASIANLYDLVGITGNYTDDKYGWKNIRTASVVRIRDGYLLKFPKPVLLD